MNQNLPVDIRAEILRAAWAHEKYDDIVAHIQTDFGKKISKGTITKTLDRYDDTGSLLDKPRSGRPNSLTQEDEMAIVDAVENDPKLTAKDVYYDNDLNKSNVSLRKIQYLLNDHGLKATTTQPKQMPERALAIRLKFAQEYVKNPQFWSKVIFSDECDLYPYKSGKLYIRRHRREHPLSYYNMSTRWDKRTVKVWGCISIDGVGPLVLYDDKMDSTTLLDIFNTDLVPEYPGLIGTRTRPGPLLFQQDNAGPHRHHDVIKWFEDNHVHKIFWPPYSPDLNPIENVWGIVQDKLNEYNRDLKTSDDVWEKSKEIWENDINQYIPQLYESMHNRIVEVIERSGARLDR